MRLFQAFTDALPSQKFISSEAEWAPIEQKEHFTSIPGNTHFESYYFPISASHKRTFKAQGYFPPNISQALVSDWLECCNILLGHMVTAVEEHSYLHGPRYLTLDLYSPIKEVVVSIKAAHGHDIGRRILRFQEYAILTDFSFWEVGLEKMSFMTNVRSVYDLDNR